MTIQKGIIDYLLTQTAITDVVSTKIRPNQAEQGITRPYLVVRQEDSEDIEHAGGAAGLAFAELDIDCHGTSQKQAMDLAELLRLELSGFSGAMGSETVRRVAFIGQRHLGSSPQQGGEIGKPAVTVSVEVHHNNTVPSF